MNNETSISILKHWDGTISSGSYRYIWFPSSNHKISTLYKLEHDNIKLKEGSWTEIRSTN